MAEASNTHDLFQLSRLSRRHIESESIDRALAMVIEAQAQLPMAGYWGLGLTASSDGQFFQAARQGEAMNLVNARNGSEPGLKAYTHVLDWFGPFATQTIPATVNEAPYVLDGLLMTRAGRRIREQYADSGGFTDHVFAVTSLLGYRFIPRIRDLPSKRLHVFETRRVPNRLIGLTGNNYYRAPGPYVDPKFRGDRPFGCAITPVPTHPERGFHRHGKSSDFTRTDDLSRPR